MHLAVIYTYTHIAGIASGQRALLHAVHQALDYGGDESGIDSTAYYTVAHHELAAPFKRYLLSVTDIHLELLVAEAVGVGSRHTFGIGFDYQMHLAKLSGTTALLLVAVVGTGSLGNGFAIGNLWFFKHDGELVIVLDTPLESAQMELALPLEYGLLEFL